ncbi:MAG TPA: hypothetical protein GXX77_00510 [Candidatus Cloacimonetes bacterium]|nr:hypothetical protein [Candidatus Cloacimonadota bacterium]
MTALLFAGEIDVSKSQAFADSLYDSNDFRSAILEYKRINYMEPDNIKFEENRFQIIQSMYYLGNYQSVIRDMSVDINAFSGNPKASYIYARSLSNIGLIDQSNEHILQNNLEDSPLKQDLQYLLMLNYLKQNQMGLAKSLINTEDMFVEADTSIQNQFKEYEKNLSKSGAVSNIINIVPGLGYLPLKSYQNALSTFLTTGFLYAMSAELYKENLNLSGTFFLSAGIIFHTGSYLGINKYNERITSKYKADLIRYLELRIP